MKNNLCRRQLVIGLLVLLLSVANLPNAKADDASDSSPAEFSNHRFGDSYRTGPSFDTNFNAERFVDLSTPSSAGAREFDSNQIRNDLRPLAKSAFDNSGQRTSSSVRLAGDDLNDWARMLRPVRDNLMDWVPASIDPVNNGGFGTGDDNGSPVPYNLNGHPDLERGVP